MAVSLGQLLLELGLDSTAFRSQLESAKVLTAQVGREMEQRLKLKVEIDPIAAQNSVKKTSTILTKPLTVKVDDRELTSLNKHLDLKQKHWAETQRTFNKPLKPLVDTSNIDRLEQRLRSLSHVNAAPTVGARSSGEASKTQKLEASIDTSKLGSSIEKAFSDALKGQKDGGIGSMVMAPFKAVVGGIKSTIGSVLDGVGLGLGQQMSKNLAKGLAEGIEGELSYLIGSFKFLGRNLGKALTEDLIQGMGADLGGVEKAILDITGVSRETIEREGFATRGKQTVEEQERRSFAGEQVRKEDKSFKQNFDVLKAQQQKLEADQKSIGDMAKAIDTKVQENISQRGGDQIRDRMSENQSQRNKISNEISIALENGDTENIDRLRSRIESLSQSYADLADKLSHLNRMAVESVSVESRQLQEKIDSFYVEKNDFQKAIASSRHRDLLKEPSIRQKGRSSDAVQSSDMGKINPIESELSVYERLVSEVAKRSNIKIDSPDMIPRIVSDAEMPENAHASYSRTTNEIRLRPDVVARLTSGDLTDKEFETVIHELRHAMQTMFGELTDKTAVAVELLNATKEEARVLGLKVEGSVSGNVGGSKSFNRAVEEDAYVFAARNFEDIKREALNSHAKAKFIDSAGIGGGIFEDTYNQNRFKILASMSRDAAKAPIDIEEEKKAMFEAVHAINDFFSESLSAIPSIEEIGIDNVDIEIARLENAMKQATLELIELAQDFTQEIKGKPEKMRTTATETMQSMSKRKDLVPIANELGIQDASKLSKKELIARISQSENVQGMSDAVMGKSRQRAQEMLRRQEAIEEAKWKAMEATERAGRFARGTVETGSAVAQKVSDIAQSQPVQQAITMTGRAIVQGAQMLGSSPVAQNALNAGKQGVRAIGGAAQLGYKAIEATESLVLDALPMGRSAKAIGKNLVLPAAGYAAATHMLPGGAAIAGGLEHLVGGALNPIIQGIGSNAASGAANMLGHALPNVMGIQQAVTAGVVNLIEQGTNAAAGGAVEAMSLALGGRILAAGGGRAIGAAGNAVQNALQPVQINSQLKLPASKSPQLQSVEVEAAIVPVKNALKMGLDNVESDLIKGTKKVSNSLEDTGDVVSAKLEYALTKINEPIPSPQKGNQKRSQPRSSDTPSVEVLGYDPKEVAEVGIQRAKGSAENLRELKKKLQKALKVGNEVISRQIFDELEEETEKALKGLTGLADGLYSEGSIGTNAGNKINNAKSQISRARNDARRMMKKARPVKSVNAFDEDQLFESRNKSLDEILSQFDKLGPEDRQHSVKDVKNSIDRLRARFDKSSSQNVVPLEIDIEDEFKKSIERQLNKDLEKRVKRKRFKKSKPFDESDFIRHEVAFNKSSNTFERTERRINDRYERSQNIDLDGKPETLAGRVRRVANIGFRDLKEKFDNNPIVNNLNKLSYAGKAVLGIFGGFVALGSIGPMLLGMAGSATQAALEFERFKRVINFTSGGEFKGAKNLKEIRDEANRLGVDLRASIAGYAQFSASTKETPLEGDTSTQIFKQVTQASANYGLDNQSQERVFTALSQMSSKGVVSMEELRQQLGESLPGALSVAARSMGMTTKQFSQMVERGEVLSSDFLPKFAQQLSAESASGVAGASKSTQASLNRLNNTLYEFQVAIGSAFLPLQKVSADATIKGIKALTRVLEFLMKILPAVAAAYSIGFIAPLITGGSLIAKIGPLIATIGAKLLAMLPAIAAFAAKFLIFQSIIDIFGMVGKVMGDQAGKFREFADSSAQSLQEYKQALNEANQAQQDFTNNLPKTSKDLKGEGLLEDSLIGNVAGLIAGKAGKEFVGKAERKIQKTLGLRTNAENQADDRTVAMNELLGSRSQRRLDVVNQIKGPNSFLKQQKEIDRQIEQIQAKRRGLAVTSPQDKEAMRTLRDQENELLKNRENIVKPVALLQQGTAQDIETYKNALKELEQLARDGKITKDEYTQKTEAFRTALKGAEKDQEELQEALKSTITPLDKFEKAWDRITAKLQDASIAMKKNADVNRIAIANAELNGGATRGQSERKTELLQQDQLREKIKANHEAISQMRAELDANDVGSIKDNYGITEGMGANEIKAIAAKVTQPKEKAILESLSELNQLEDEISGFEADLAESLVVAKRKLADTTKSVDDFYRTIARQAQEAALDAKSMQVEITGLRAKNKLKASLSRMNDSYISEYVDGLVGLIDQMQEPFKIAIENQKVQASKINALNDTLRQRQELSESLPSGQEAGGMGGGVDADQGTIKNPIQKAFKSGLFSGPSARIGGSAEYHIDTKVSRDLSWKQIVEMFDNMASAYRLQGRKIEFSNQAVSGLVYNENQAYEAKEQMLKKAFEAHHSQSRDIRNGVRSIDYYLPKIGKSRFDESPGNVDNVEVMLPQIPGSKLEYASGGGYGNYVNIYDRSGKYLMSTGHGDNAKALPKNRTIPLLQPETPRNAIGPGRMGGGGIGSGGMGGGTPKPDQFVGAVLSILESGSRQGRVDVAQVISNRVGTNFDGFGKSIRSQAFASGQFQPFFKGTYGIGKNDIQDMDSAITALKKAGFSSSGAKSALNNFFSDVQNPAMVADSKSKVGGRAYFKGVSERRHMSGDDFLRSRALTENFYHHEDSDTRNRVAANISDVFSPSRRQNRPSNAIAPTGRIQQSMSSTPQRSVIIPYDHARGRVPDRTGGNTFSAAGATGAAHAGQTERDYQDLIIPDLEKKLKTQGYRVVTVRPEDFRSYEEYDAFIKKESSKPNSIVVPVHLDAKGGSALTRVRAGDAQDAKLGNSLLNRLRQTVKTSRITGQDTQANATVNIAGSAPAALVELGVMSDFIARYGNARNYIRSSEAQNINHGLVAGINDFFGGVPRSGSRPINTIMPTTGRSQVQIQSLEAESKAYSDLQSKIGDGGNLATQTTNRSIELANQLAKEKGIQARLDADRQVRRKTRQLKQSGLDQQDQTIGLTQEIENLERSLGPDTPNKALKNQLQDIKRNREKLGKDLTKNEEKVNEALADLKAALPAVQEAVSNGLIPQANLDALKKQIPLLEEQVRQNAANRTKYNALDKKLIDDLKEKFNYEQKAREFARDQELSGQQIAERRSQAEKLRTKAGQEFTSPLDRKKAEDDALKLTYEADKAERKNRLDADLKALADKARNDPQTYDAKTVTEAQKRLYTAAGADFARLEQNYKNATQTLTTEESRRQRELETGLKQSELDRARQQAQAASQTVSRLGQFGNVRTGDMQITASQAVFDAGKAELDFSLEQFKQQQEELVRSGKSTREEADKTIAAFEELNQVKLSDLQNQLDETRRAAQFSDIDVGKQESERLRTVADRSSPFSLEGLQMRRKSAQDILNLTKQEVELRAQAFREEQESLVTRKIISREMANKAIGRMEQSKRMKIEDADYQFQQSTRDANRTYDDARFDIGRMQIQSRTGLRSVQAGYASAYGFDYQAKQFQKANAIDEQKMKYMEGSREIDRLAEAGGKLEKSPEIVAQLRENLEQLNRIELNTINAQFNPLVDGLKSVKGAFQGFLSDVIVGNMSIEEAFNKMIENVLNSLAQLAAQLITEQLFGAIFGVGGGGGLFGGGGGSGGGIFGSIFGFASGGDVPTADHGSMRDRPDAIGQALRREGPNSVLATLTPGEKVLSVAQTQRYHAMGLDRFVESSSRVALASAQRSEGFGKIFQFNAGGIVPGGAAIPTPKIQNGGDTINIPININSDGGAKPSIDTNRMNDAVRNAVIQEIRRQKRPNGELN